MSLTKKCKKCFQEKTINKFGIRKSRGKEYVNNICIVCIKQQQKKHRENNKETKKKQNKEYYERIKLTPEFVEKSKQYREENKDYKREYDKNYRETHREEIKEYCKENREEIVKMRHDYYITHKEKIKILNQGWYIKNTNRKHKINAKYISGRLKRDPVFKLRFNTRRTISKYMRLNNSSKNGSSILNFLAYSIDDLKIHLENLFETWMTWDNYGKYDKNIWNDGDQTTWKWNVDHIIPQSDLPYTSMEDENFKKCWALDNLRPYSAKQNLLDGINKVRHG